MKQDNVRGILNTLEVKYRGKSVRLSDYILSLTVTDSQIQLMLEGPISLSEALSLLKSQAETVLKKTYPEITVQCLVTIQKPQSKPISDQKKLEGVKRIISVASGKGGVGKSTVSVNLALALQQKGYRVGLLDADIYGPSLPTMLGITEKPGVTDDKKLIPLHKYGLSLLSMGLMVPPDKAMIWRGPMVHGALQQMLKSVVWDAHGPLDVLIIDMPPGTGDVSLTLAQQVQLEGAVIVSTPQDIALLDARRGIQMFQQLSVPILGIVENMSIFMCPHCGQGTAIFDQGGARKTAEELGIPFLGEIPLHPGLRLGADSGIPYLQSSPIVNREDPISRAYSIIVERVSEKWTGLEGNRVSR